MGGAWRVTEELNSNSFFTFKTGNSVKTTSGQLNFAVHIDKRSDRTSQKPRFLPRSKKFNLLAILKSSGSILNTLRINQWKFRQYF